MTMHSFEDYRRNPFLAVPAVGQLLRRGSLSLSLGSGISSGFGLPEWALLIARILGRGEEPAFVDTLKKESDQAKRSRVDPCDDGSSTYVRKIHDALYAEVPADLEDHLARSPLLLAVAALVSGSTRGRIESVTTYNYDDLLERYLRMLGYSVSVRTSASDLVERADVVVNHPHGFIPQDHPDRADPEDIVLSERSYRSRRAFIDREWSAHFGYTLATKILLLIGLSGDDSFTLDQMERYRELVNRKDEYLGYWLLTPGAFDRNWKTILDLAVCPIALTREEFAPFVFQVCRNAAS